MSNNFVVDFGHERDASLLGDERAERISESSYVRALVPKRRQVNESHYVYVIGDFLSNEHPPTLRPSLQVQGHSCVVANGRNPIRSDSSLRRGSARVKTP